MPTRVSRNLLVFTAPDVLHILTIHLLSEAKLEILQKGENGKLLAPSDANCTLTAGDYHLARLYMSQKEDAKNNWIGNAGDEMKKSAQRLAKAVESLGVANGSGMLDFSSVKGLM